jgi:DNA-binding NarL/FixJ family response regulator
MNIVIIDDHKLFRIGITEILNRSRAHRVVAEFANGSGMLALFQDAPNHLALIDVNLGEENGVDLIVSLRERFKNLRTAVLSMHKEPTIISRAINSGVDGYFHKDIDQEELVFGIKKIEEGGKYFSAQITEILLSSRADSEKESYHPLTDREKQILHYLVDGFASHEIAAKMKISKRTVDGHRSNILTKFGCRNTAQLVRLIIDRKYFNK